jgi:stage V sporulation protein R
LFLEHRYSGVELQTNYAQDTLLNLYKLWKRPVHIETVLEDCRLILSFDGHEHSRTGEGKITKSR